MNAELITYDVTQETIAELKSQFLQLVVTDPSDKEGFKKCKDARLMVRDRRIAVEKRRKELKEESLRTGRLIDEKARAITSQLEEIEAHLSAQEDVVKNEEKRLKEEAERVMKERLETRLQKLSPLNTPITVEILDFLNTADEEEFYKFLANELATFKAKKAEQERKDAELAKLRAESESAAERARLAQEESDRLTDELLAQQKREIEERRERERKEAEEKLARELAAKKKIDDEKMFDAIKKKFPTVEECWVELHRLYKSGAR